MHTIVAIVNTYFSDNYECMLNCPPPPSFPDIDYILSANTISTVANVQNRLVFDEQNSTQVKRTLSFNAPGAEITDTVTVYASVSYRNILEMRLASHNACFNAIIINPT